MDNVQGLSTANVDWSKLVDAINDANPLANVEKASFDAGTNAVTITTAGENAKTVTISVPDIDSPGMVVPSELDSLVAKLGESGAFALTDEQLAEISETLDRQFAAAIASAGGGEVALTGTNVMFDIYQLMSLMLEVAQKQRNAMREIRQAENEAIQTSIQNQAEMQRAAALTGMIAGIVVCAVQVVAQGVALGKSAQAYKQQHAVGEKVGLPEAQKGLTDAKAALKSEQAAVDARSKEFAKLTGGEVDTAAMQKFMDANGLTGRSIEGVRADLKVQSDASVAAAEKNVQTKEVATVEAQKEITAAKSQLEAEQAASQKRTDDLAKIKEMPEDTPDQIQAKSAALEKFTRDNGLEGYRDKALDDQLALKNKTSVQKAVDDLTVKESVASQANQELTQAKTELAEKQQAATDDAARLRQIEEMPQGTQEEIAARKTALDDFIDQKQIRTAGTENIRAELTASNDARIDAAKTNVRVAEARLGQLESAMSSHTEFLDASQAQMKWRSLGDIFAAIGNAAQGVVRSASDMAQAKATEVGAVQKEAEEQLEQARDLFNLGQDIVNKVLQLMSAVLQAESQSMNDAIHA